MYRQEIQRLNSATYSATVDPSGSLFVHESGLRANGLVDRHVIGEYKFHLDRYEWIKAGEIIVAIQPGTVYSPRIDLYSRKNGTRLIIILHSRHIANIYVAEKINQQWTIVFTFENEKLNPMSVSTNGNIIITGKRETYLFYEKGEWKVRTSVLIPISWRPQLENAEYSPINFLVDNTLINPIANVKVMYDFPRSEGDYTVQRSDANGLVYIRVNDEIRIYNTLTWKQIGSIPINGNLYSLYVSNDGKFLVYGSRIPQENSVDTRQEYTTILFLAVKNQHGEYDIHKLPFYSDRVFFIRDSTFIVGISKSSTKNHEVRTLMLNRESLASLLSDQHAMLVAGLITLKDERMNRLYNLLSNLPPEMVKIVFRMMTGVNYVGSIDLELDKSLRNEYLLKILHSSP